MSESATPSGERVGPVLVSYTCPGELYSIPRGTHLARLASYYYKCRDCLHRNDTGHFVPNHSTLESESAPRAEQSTLVTDESVRGVYLNELDRNRSLAWGEAVASLLWDQHPMVARREQIDHAQIIVETVNRPRTAARGPNVVVGFDERSSSPDIVTGLVQGMRRMGCAVVDLGQTTIPVLAFHLHSLSATAGVFVTGAGCNPSYTGFEFIARGGLPFSRETLLQLEQTLKTGVGRQTRQIGALSSFNRHDALSHYETNLGESVHALRPLRIVCGTSSRLLQRSLERLFAKLPCSLTHVVLPTRRRDLFDGRDVDLQRVATAVVEGQHHLGVLIDEDGRHAAFVTDRGRLVSPQEIARLLMELVQREQHAANFIVSTSWWKDANRWLNGRDAKVVDGGETAGALVQLLIESEAVMAMSADGRIWFRQEYPACDGLLILTRVLQALSLSDAPFSEVVARISADMNGKS